MVAILVLGDFLLAVLAVSAGYAARWQFFPGIKEFFFSHGHRAVLFAVVIVIASFTVELYDREKNRRRVEILFRISISIGLTLFALSALFYLLRPFQLFRGELAFTLVFFAVFQFSWHAGCRLFLALPQMAKRVLILGTGPLADSIGKVLAGNGYSHVFLGYVSCQGGIHAVPPQEVVNNGEKIIETVRRQKADQLVVSLSERRGVFPLQDVLTCKMSGVEVVDAPSFYESLTGKILIENINPSWFIFNDGFRATSYRTIFKRPFDVVLALTGLIVCLPLFLILPILIALDSRGPIFYRQVRFGKDEKEFTLYKFRTMQNDAEKDTGAVWAQEDDPRITRAGRFLRKTRLDEIPQLFNVLRGDMSLVGPRPERPEFVESLKEQIPYYTERHFVKPGVTGWAQVKYPYGASVDDSMEKLRYDLYYIKRLSANLDFMIIVDTVRVVLFGRGGR